MKKATRWNAGWPSTTAAAARRGVASRAWRTSSAIRRCSASASHRRRFGPPPWGGQGMAAPTVLSAKLLRFGRRLFRDGIDAIGIERDVVLDRGDRFVRIFVGPYGVHRTRAAG